MPLTVGAHLGPYEIVAPLGAGETGEVYRARDTRLNRAVTIRVLPPAWVTDPEMKQCVERNARTLAGLNHPHICTLHDVGEAVVSHEPSAATHESPAASHQPSALSHDTVHYLVLEHLEGETLAQRLERGALPVRDVLATAIAIADALDKAHQHGIVHRDLKPSSVFLCRSGGSSAKVSADPPIAKLLDFALTQSGAGGAGKAGEAGRAGEAGGLSALPTKAPTMAPGTIAGPVDYITPEQLEGKGADARTDIFAFGVVVHEALTGRKAFEGKTRTVLIATIMTSDPDPLTKTNPAIPSSLEHVVKRCLAKDPDDRWQTAHDLLVQLRFIAGAGARSGLPAGTAAPRGKQERLVRVLLGVAALLVVALAAPAFLYLRGPAEPNQFQFRAPVVGLTATSISVSPDGRSIVLLARPNPQEPSSLYVRPIGAVTFRKLAGTDDGAQPFWSPDSRFIGFVGGAKLKKVEASGGPPQEICPTEGFSGGTWNRDGAILFGSAKGLFRVSAEGGKPEAITTVEKTETGHFWPYFLPDGRHYLFLAWSAQPSDRAVFIGALDSKQKTRLMPAESNVAYAPSTDSRQAPGYLVFHREATVFAQPFDATKLTLAGDAVQIAGGAAFSATSGQGNFDVSQNGVLIYFQGAGAATGRAQTAAVVQFGWIDRSGQQQAVAGEQGPYGDMDVSPDGKLIAVTRQETGAPGADIWVIDWQRAGVSTRLTLDPADDLNPVWSPDGARIAFTTYRKGNADVYVKNANGVGAETPLLESSSNESVEDWSRDGRYIAFLFGQDNFQDIYALPLFGDKKPFPVVQGRFQKNEPQFSHDGKWLAYTSDESGTFQVYVMSFPAGDQKLQISTSGGGQPRWGRDGKALYYRALDNSVMAVDVKPGAKIESGVPRLLFNPFVNVAMTQDPGRHQLALGPDGRFLLRVPPNLNVGGRSSAPQAPIAYFPATGQATGRAGLGRAGGAGAATLNGLTVVMNWPAGLRKAK